MLRLLALISLIAAMSAPYPALAFGKNERHAAGLLLGAIIAGQALRLNPVLADDGPPITSRLSSTLHLPAQLRPQATTLPAVPTSAAAFNQFRKSDRRRIQQRLQAAGLYTGPIDGFWGPATAASVQSWAHQRQ